MASNQKFDFVISGAGLVGCLVASQLAKLGLKCCLIEKNKINDISLVNNYSPLSLNYRSYLILKKFELWEEILPHVYPIRNLTIKSYHSLNRLTFNAKDIYLNDLGYVVDRRNLLQEFLNNIKSSSNITIFDQETVSGFQDHTEDEEYGLIGKLLSGQSIEAKYLIVSDGIESKIKDKLNIKSLKIDYSQISFVFNAKAFFKKYSAVQIFNKYGIFAGIPYGNDRTNIILTINKKDIPIFFNDKDKIKKNSLQNIFKDYMSDISDLKFVSQYDLLTSRSKEISRNNIILLGNSSQLLHPVGAQGFNLAVNNIDSLIKFLGNGKLDIAGLTNEINKSRESVFDNIDVATNILGGEKIPSKLLSFFLINSIKSSQTMKNTFLKNMLGINNYPYLNIGADI
ncbi:FAD-dependent monooxygenase [Gammaproteobacteria bacterium]|nr:FAD-dependent monooxygenase [Gammaproteobacteria bacterium]